MNEMNQREYWEIQHQKRENGNETIIEEPNIFTKECIQYIPENGKVLEIGSANGRDARYFAREKNIETIAIDFSAEVMKQLTKASKEDNTSDLVLPVIAETNHLPLDRPDIFDAIYSRSALHLSDDDLSIFLDRATKILKSKGYLMIEGKTKDDFKISRSVEVSPNLYRDNDGHLRRAWDEQSIHNLLEKNKLQLISSKKTEENWKGNKTNFINFIIQKM